jgi:hypothetical protein
MPAHRLLLLLLLLPKLRGSVNSLFSAVTNQSLFIYLLNPAPERHHRVLGRARCLTSVSIASHDQAKRYTLSSLPALISRRRCRTRPSGRPRNRSDSIEIRCRTDLDQVHSGCGCGDGMFVCVCVCARARACERCEIQRAVGTLNFTPVDSVIFIGEVEGHEDWMTTMTTAAISIVYRH